MDYVLFRRFKLFGAGHQLKYGTLIQNCLKKNAVRSFDLTAQNFRYPLRPQRTRLHTEVRYDYFFTAFLRAAVFAAAFFFSSAPNSEPCLYSTDALAAASRAIGTLNGEQDT